MPTARQTITRALRMLGVLAGGEPPSDTDASEALEALNSMLRGYVLSHAPGFADLTLDDSLPYPSTFAEGLAAMLATRLAPEHAKATPAEVQAMATRGENLLRAYYGDPGRMIADLGLLRRNPDPDQGDDAAFEDLSFNNFGWL